MSLPPVAMPTERRTTLLLNGAELLTVQTTPVHLDDWAVGFLYTEGLIQSITDIETLTTDLPGARVSATIAPEKVAALDIPTQRYLTSGCGKGVTFSSIKDAMLLQPVGHDLTVAPGQLLAWIRQMQRQSPLYSESGGMHAAAVVHTETEELIVREDIGRHNAVDKAIGAALKAGWPPERVVLLTSGRISYEMCAKAARYGAGVAASLTAATDQAIRLANRLGLDLVGYVRKEERMLLYTEGRRIAGSETAGR
ncbi:MAG TPA: formate dehydrogenase accessory sulfurtransferase FdhD [Symbiobacteriaceae bacterium]|nr:formate dehydrogenase accessory sulfurtransferase FdhD [Symbiobacteriaceae bacterium]